MSLRQTLSTLGRTPIAAADVDGGEGVARYVRSGALGAAGGAVSLLRAASAYRRGDRKRAAIRALIAGLWIGGAVVQRRRRGRSASRGAAGASGSVDQRDVVDTSVGDLEAAAGEGPGGERTETDDAGVDQSDVAETGADIEDAATDREDEEHRAAGRSTEADDAGVDQRDVVDTAPDYEEAADENGESDGGGETNERADRGESGRATGGDGAGTTADEDGTETDDGDEGDGPYDPTVSE